MPTGPKPKPTSLKLVQGNPGKRPIPEDEPKPEVVKSPKRDRGRLLQAFRLGRERTRAYLSHVQQKGHGK
jgi:hypothetical protein